MYRIVVMRAEPEDEKEVSRSANYRLCKRKARYYAATDPSAWFGKFIMYDGDDVIEEGNIISSRISWSKRKG